MTEFKKQGTLTSYGFVPYKRVNGMVLTVKLDIPRKTNDLEQYFPPLVKDGSYVYATPGGGEYWECQ